MVQTAELFAGLMASRSTVVILALVHLRVGM